MCHSSIARSRYVTQVRLHWLIQWSVSHWRTGQNQSAACCNLNHHTVMLIIYISTRNSLVHTKVVKYVARESQFIHSNTGIGFAVYLQSSCEANWFLRYSTLIRIKPTTASGNIFEARNRFNRAVTTLIRVSAYSTFQHRLAVTAGVLSNHKIAKPQPPSSESTEPPPVTSNHGPAQPSRRPILPHQTGPHQHPLAIPPSEYYQPPPPQAYAFQRNIEISH